MHTFTANQRSRKEMALDACGNLVSKLVNVEHASACLSGASNEQHKLKHAQRFPVSINHSGKQTNATS